MDRTLLRIFVGIVLLLMSGALVAAPQGLPEQVVPQMFGVDLNFAGSNEREIGQIADSGLKIVRVRMAWDSIEKTAGTYDFSAFDSLLDSLDANGMRAIFVLDRPNPLYESGAPPHTLEGRSAFTAMAAAAATRYKDRGVMWEIWNEANTAASWKPKANAADYVALVKSVSSAIKSADPKAVIIGPSTSGIDLGFLQECFKLGLLTSVDAISVHPYRTAAPESVEVDYARLRELIGRHAPEDRQIAVISGEWGYNSVAFSEEQQADYLARTYLVNILSDVRASVWYDWRDDGRTKGDEHHFGLTHNDFAPKPACTAAVTLARELEGCKLVRRIINKPDEYLLLFKGPNGYRLAAWTTGEERETQIAVGGEKVKLVGIDGKESDASPSDGKLTLKLSGSPVIVELGGSERMALEEAVDIKAKLDTKWRLQDVIAVSISNPMTRPIKGEFAITIPGHKNPYKKKFNVAPGKSQSFDIKPVILWDGRSQVIAEAVVTFDGFEHPVTRMVDLGNEHRISAKPSAPLDNLIEFRIVSPQGHKVKGKLRLYDVKGIKPVTDSIGFLVENQSVVVLTLKEPAPKRFSFGYQLEDGTKKVIFRSPVLEYTMIEDFSGDEVGTAVRGVSLRVEGDSGAAGDVMCVEDPTHYVGLPKTNMCRLRYESGSSKSSFSLAPGGDIVIPENPIEIGMWLKGDGSGNMGRCRFVDAAGQTFQPNGFVIDFSGWRYRSLPLDGLDAQSWGGTAQTPQHPIKLESLLVIDTLGSGTRGSLLIGPIMVVSELVEQPK